MHRWDEGTDLLAHSVVGYAIERLKTPKDTTWGARPADELAAALDGAVGPEGIGGHEALMLFRDVLMHACRPMDSPLHLAYVATAPTPRGRHPPAAAGPACRQPARNRRFRNDRG